MKTDDFEKRLQRQSHREVPSAWRVEILSAARKAETSCHPSPVTRHSPLSTLIQQLSTLLLPRRAAWAGLAAAWLVISLMNLSSRDNPGFTVANTSLSTPETLQVLKEQRLLLAELVERPAPPEVDRIKIVPVGPRSQRRDEIATG